MKTKFDITNISIAEYNYYKQLNNTDKIRYLFDIYDINPINSNKAIDLTEFFIDVHNSLKNDVETYSDISSNQQDRVDIMIDDQNILIESNSLRAVRYVMNKFTESGYILSRDIKLEKMFRKDKLTRYLRVFNIISQVSTICLN